MKRHIIGIILMASSLFPYVMSRQSYTVSSKDDGEIGLYIDVIEAGKYYGEIHHYYLIGADYLEVTSRFPLNALALTPKSWKELSKEVTMNHHHFHIQGTDYNYVLMQQGKHLFAYDCSGQRLQDDEIVKMMIAHHPRHKMLINAFMYGFFSYNGYDAINKMLYNDQVLHFEQRSYDCNEFSRKADIPCYSAGNTEIMRKFNAFAKSGNCRDYLEMARSLAVSSSRDYLFMYDSIMWLVLQSRYASHYLNSYGDTIKALKRDDMLQSDYTLRGYVRMDSSENICASLSTYYRIKQDEEALDEMLIGCRYDRLVVVNYLLLMFYNDRAAYIPDIDAITNSLLYQAVTDYVEHRNNIEVHRTEDCNPVNTLVQIFKELANKSYKPENYKEFYHSFPFYREFVHVMIDRYRSSEAHHEG